MLAKDEKTDRGEQTKLVKSTLACLNRNDGIAVVVAAATSAAPEDAHAS